MSMRFRSVPASLLRSWRRGLLVGLAVCGTFAAAPTASHAAGKSCAQGKASRFAETDYAVIYRRGTQYQSGYTSVVGCWRPTGRRTLLVSQLVGVKFKNARLRRPTLRGRYAAFTQYYDGGYDSASSFERVLAVDLRSGQLAACQPKARTGVAELVLAANGAVAWTTADRRQLLLIDRRGQRTLVRNSDTEISDLSVKSGRVFWRRGTRRAAAGHQAAATRTPACEGSDVRAFPRRPCPRGGTTLAANDLLRVYLVAGGLSFGCFFGDGRRLNLAVTETGNPAEIPEDTVIRGPYAVAGSAVAAIVDDAESGCCVITVVDLQQRRRVRSLAVDLPRPSSIAVTAEGFVAAILDRSPASRPQGTPPSFQVVISDRTPSKSSGATRRVVAQGERIDPASLRADGRTLRWLEDGQPRTATMGPTPSQSP